MVVEKGKVISIEYTLKDAEGEVMDTTEGVGPMDYIHGMQALIPGLEKEMEGKKTGDAFSVVVEPADAYGDYSDELVLDVPRSNFPADVDIQVGMQFEAESGHAVTILEIKDDTIKIDANHPLAGEKLFFDIKIVDIREPTKEELSSLSCGGGCSGHCGDCGSDCYDDYDDGCCGGSCNC
ncbi:MAG: peptidylprolyl isomerase [Treponema sp.]|nr:peptidylprolyl isomerase [Treponema sp.]